VDPFAFSQVEWWSLYPSFSLAPPMVKDSPTQILLTLPFLFPSGDGLFLFQTIFFLCTVEDAFFTSSILAFLLPPFFLSLQVNPRSLSSLYRNWFAARWHSPDDDVTVLFPLSLRSWTFLGFFRCPWGSFRTSYTQPLFFPPSWQPRVHSSPAPWLISLNFSSQPVYARFGKAMRSAAFPFDLLFPFSSKRGLGGGVSSFSFSKPFPGSSHWLSPVCRGRLNPMFLLLSSISPLMSKEIHFFFVFFPFGTPSSMRPGLWEVFSFFSFSTWDSGPAEMFAMSEQSYFILLLLPKGLMPPFQRK